MRVVVTGATGYLGGRLCAALAGAGHAVRALVRHSSDVSGLPRDIEMTYGDVTDAESLAVAFDGCDVVFHVAAAVEPWLPNPSVFFKVRQLLLFIYTPSSVCVALKTRSISFGP
jgi:NAD+-dependent farnesol dehydrogenase